MSGPMERHGLDTPHPASWVKVTAVVLAVVVVVAVIGGMLIY